ncbi:hypothetical protein SNEBB_008771, partial [Seison nebaliae]
MILLRFVVVSFALSLNWIIFSELTSTCYKGRYRDNFIYYPGFLNNYDLIPFKCVEACSTLETPSIMHATIVNGICLCATTLPSNPDSGSVNCEQPCPGDPSQYCGGKQNDPHDYDDYYYLSFDVIKREQTVKINTLTLTYVSTIEHSEPNYVEVGNPKLEIIASVTTQPATYEQHTTVLNYEVGLYFNENSDSYYFSKFDAVYNLAIYLPYPGLFVLKVLASIGNERKELKTYVKFNSDINNGNSDRIIFDCLRTNNIVEHLFTCQSTILFQKKDSSVKTESTYSVEIDYGSDMSVFPSQSSTVPIKKINFMILGAPLHRFDEVILRDGNYLLNNIRIDRQCYLVNAIVGENVESLKVVRPSNPIGSKCMEGEIFCANTGRCMNGTAIDLCRKGYRSDNLMSINSDLKIVHEFNPNEINKISGTNTNIGNVNNEFSFMLLPGDRIVATVNGRINNVESSQILNGNFDEFLVTIQGVDIIVNPSNVISPLPIGIVTAMPTGAFLGYQYSSIGIFPVTVGLEQEDGSVGMSGQINVTSFKLISEFYFEPDPNMSEDDCILDNEANELIVRSDTPIKLVMVHVDDELGNPIIYEVSIGGSTTNYSTNSFEYTFASGSSYLIEVRAMNALNEVEEILPVKVTDPLTNLKLTFMTGNSTTKNSITYVEMSIDGGPYQCEIWYDYKKIDSAFDIAYNYSVFPSGSMLQKTYTELGNYKIKVRCFNMLSSLEVEKIIQVQERITGLNFGQLSYYFGESYRYTASVATGSPITAELFVVDGEISNNVTIEVNGYDLRSKLFPGILLKKTIKLTLKACNSLGCSTLEDYLFIDYNILPPIITTDIPEDKKVSFEGSVSVTVEMVEGSTNPSDVDVDFDFGDNSLQTSQLEQGSSITQVTKQFTYTATTGNLEIVVCVRNLVNEYKESYMIRVVSPIGDKFELKLTKNPIPYLLTSGLAELYLEAKNPDDAHFGQPAQARCWWGDDTQTPPLIGSSEEYVDISNKKIVSHLYNIPITYVAKCEVGNEEGYVNFSTTINIKQAIVGLEIRIDDVLVEEPVEIKVTALKGPPITDTQLKFYVDSSLKETKQRENEYYEDFDVFSYTFTTLGSAEVKIEAIDTITAFTVTSKKVVMVKPNIQPSNFEVDLLPPQSAEQIFNHLSVTYGFKLKYLSASISPSTNPVDDTTQLGMKMFVKETEENLLTTSQVSLSFTGDGTSDEEFLLDSSLSVRPLIINFPGTFTVVVQLSNGAKTINIEKIISLYVQPYFEIEPFKILFKPKLPLGSAARGGYGTNKIIFPSKSEVQIIPKIKIGTVNSYELLIDGTEVGERVVDPSKIYYTLPNAGEPKLSLKINYATTNFKISTTKLISVMKSLTSAS